MNTAKSFTAVLDGRKRKVRNLWQRGDIFYARLKIPYPGEETPKVRRIPLKAKTVPSAIKELRETSLVVQLGLPMRVQPVSCGIRSDKTLAHRKSYQLRQPIWNWPNSASYPANVQPSSAQFVYETKEKG